MSFYRVSNNGQTTWKPQVKDVKVFSDHGCSNQILASYVNESGHKGEWDGSKALDNELTTYWKPQCGPCEKNEAWLIFSTAGDAKCVNTIKLGKGTVGGRTWNTGIEVELQNNHCSWTTVMQASTGNIAIAQGTHLTIEST